MKLKKIISLALCGLMLICIIPLLSLSKASDDVVFLVVNNVVSRPLSASTMPIGVNKEVYVPYTTLAGACGSYLILPTTAPMTSNAPDTTIPLSISTIPSIFPSIHSAPDLTCTTR